MIKKQISPAVGGASCVEQEQNTDKSIFEAIEAETEKTAALNRAEQVAKVSDSLNEPTTDKELAELFFGCFSITDEDRDEPIKYTITKGGAGTLPIGDISAVKGLAKHGKTWFVSILCASVLGCGGFGYETANKAFKVLVVDTEQHRRNVVKVRKRILSLAGADASERLQIVALRELTHTQRANAIELAVSSFRPDFVVVDGVADLIADFNNAQESANIIAYLSKLASVYDCHILNVLHIARTSESGGMKGHLGSMLLQKCSDCFGVKKSADGVFTAEHTESRNMTTSEINFAISNELPILGDELLAANMREKAREKELAEMAELKAIFGNDKELTFKDLQNRIAAHFGKTARTGTNKITAYLAKGQLIQNAENKTYFIAPQV